jgi:alkyl sulfatase BDS1-like metallo-beta-lactamase superfamily hydrolase
MEGILAAENITATIHNIYTLRGAMVRDALAWSKNINEALWRYGQEAEIMFASHSWPRFGNARVQEVMRGQRDTYAHLNNYVLFLTNQGVTINEVHNVNPVFQIMPGTVTGQVLAENAAADPFEQPEPELLGE